MKIRSLSYQTDLIFIREDGEVIDRGHYSVIRTHSNPNYFWGNLLLFEKPPQKDDFTLWTELFKKEFSDPRIYHQTFAWDSPQGELGQVTAFLQDGFKLEKGVTLTAQSVHLPQKHCPELTIRSISSEAEWESVIRIHVSCSNHELGAQEMEKFYRSQTERYKKLIAKNQGHWFGGFLKEKIVASLGIFQEGELGRYQLVGVDPQFQRRGICGSLVFQTAQFAFSKMGVGTLVMVADEDYHAAKIYESVGFKPTEKLLGLCKYSKQSR